MLYSKTHLTNVLIDALLRNNGIADRGLVNEYKRQRFNAVARALLSRNLFIPITKHPAVENQQDVVTGYALPLQEDVMLWGITWTSANTEPSSDHGRMMTIQVDGHDLISNVGTSMIPFGGIDTTNGFSFTEMGYGVVALPVPKILPAGSRVVAQFSYNPSSGYDGESMPPGLYDSVVLFCLAVKTCINDEDRQILEICREWINDHDYQVPVNLNMVTPPTDSNLSIIWNGNGASGGGEDGLLTTSETRPVGLPILIRALATNLMMSRLQLRDTRNHDFTPAGYVLMRNFIRHAAGNNSPLSTHFKLTMPHVLAPGAQLKADHLDGTGANLGPFAIDQAVLLPVTGTLPPCWLTFSGVTP